MSGKTVTCVQCGGAVDDGDTIEMPNGLTCTNCYRWLESMMDEMIEADDL